MSEEAKEQISALMDGEVGPERRLRIVDELLCDPGLVKAWERYNLISDVLRNNVCEAAIGSFSRSRPYASAQTVAQNGQNEQPIGVARIDGQRERFSVSYIATEVAERLRQEPVVLRPRNRIALKPAIGFAVAASLAIVAVLGVQRVAQGPLTGSDTPALQATFSSSSQDRVLASATTNGDPGRTAAQARLSSYLVNYSEYLDNGMRGLLPYARIVSHHDANTP